MDKRKRAVTAAGTAQERRRLGLPDGSSGTEPDEPYKAVPEVGREACTDDEGTESDIYKKNIGKNLADKKNFGIFAV